ncbi:MAG: dihydrofolate reductase family protein [Chloroflexi bacterium]|nr:dihydrofolate reductase family protein [Chloroflexota bacterium]
MNDIDTLLLGRKTYDAAAESWPNLTNDEISFADKMNSIPKFVVSSTLASGSWNPTTVIKDNVAETVAALKQQPGGDIYIYGSNTLVRTLMQQDLIDEYRLMIYPLVLGSGKRFLAGDIAPAQFKLVDSKIFSSGVVALIYQPARTA